MRNRLAEETSPYLLQHADNPVHWQPWSSQALDEAKAQNKPILLSIGYSACHWCHVMAHESFEDDDTARLMNDLFVNIKVDREERPDLDKIYQTAHQLFTGQPGGWPLTVFLAPDGQTPIFTGTYFPKDRRYGMPAFREVLTAINTYFRAQPAEIEQRGASLVQALAEIETGSADEFAQLSHAPLEQARQRLAENYDPEHGGFGSHPKFPHTTHLELLLAHWRSHPQDTAALNMVKHTLDRMALGGLFDQLGGGFYRYSVDRFWTIPHFEKMLYDNAALLAIYADAYSGTGAELYSRVAIETAAWVMRDMQSENGAFYSTLDADSEHEEGKFYVWTPDEIDAVLAADESRVAKRAFGLAGANDQPTEPNFERKHWHLQLAIQPNRLGAALGMNDERAVELFESARRKLLAAREQRVWPGRDEKALVSWNGLMIGALARAARRLSSPELADAATRAVDFIRAELWSDGRLKATYKDGRARFAAYLDDYAFLADGLVELLQYRWRTSDLTFACELLDTLLAHYEDPRGGFFFTADDHEKLLHKPKPFADEAVPSGNGKAAVALLSLGHLLGEQRYLDAAERTVRAAMYGIQRYPEGHATLLQALAGLVTPPELVIVRAPASSLDTWQRELDAGYHPHRLSFAIPSEESQLPGLLAERTTQGAATAYLCEGTTCRTPITDLATLHTALSP